MLKCRRHAIDIKPRILSTAINEDDNTASLALAMEVAGYFDLEDGKAREIAKQVGKAVSKWRDEAARYGLTKNEIDSLRQCLNRRHCPAMCSSWSASPIIRSTVFTNSCPGTWPQSFQGISQHLKCPRKNRWTLKPPFSYQAPDQRP